MTTLWTVGDTPKDFGWSGITSGNNMFVAVALRRTNRPDYRIIWKSFSGDVWQIASTNTNDWLSDVSFGNNVFVAVSSGNYANARTDARVFYSTDGINWVRKNETARSDWQSIAFGNNIFMAVGSAGPGARCIFSDNGINWNTVGVTRLSWRGITFANGIWVIVGDNGNIGRSINNGSSWTYVTTSVNNSWQSVTFGNGLFVTVSSGPDTGNRVATSPDGITWTIRTTPADNKWTKVIFGDGLFVAVSITGTNTISDYQNRCMTSFNGIDWVLRNTPTPQFTSSSTCVGFGNNLYIALGNSEITSTYPAPSLTDFVIPEKKIADPPFTLTSPTSNSTGTFIYTSSDPLIASVTGDTVTINNFGTTIITATQQSTQDYTSGTITTTFQVNQESPPTITNFSIPSKTYGDTPFQITQPTSNSSGSFSYASSNLSVATISGNTIIIVGVGTSTITSTQESTTNYTSGTITTTFQVNQSTPINPVIIDSSDELLYFMNTSSSYANITNNLEINYDLTALSYKVLTGNNITIIKSNN